MRMSPSHPEIALFALRSGRAFGLRVAEELGHRLADHEEREFEWGQHKARPLESVRGKDVYVVQSLHGDAEQSTNDKLCRLLFFLGALRDSDAGRVSAVVPFLCYSRKEVKTKPRDPVTTRYVAALFEAVGVDRVVTLEVHNPAAFQNAFRCRTEHLEAHGLFGAFFAERFADRDVAVVSPDVGGIKRADRYRRALEHRLARPLADGFVEKHRSAGVVSGERLVGEVAGRTVLLVDDMISAGTTLARASEACRKAGAREVVAAAAHGAFVPAASRVLADAPLDRIVVLDHIPPDALEPALVEAKLTLLDAASLVAEAIRRMHGGGSLVELLEG
jgi:ribose-phosphate pyrophosphokinase